MFVIKGYVDDPRNTDNAWMETCVTLFYDKDGVLTKDFELEAGDDAGDVTWMKIDLGNPNFKLYASHRRFVEMAVHYIKNPKKSSCGTKQTCQIL